MSRNSTGPLRFMNWRRHLILGAFVAVICSPHNDARAQASPPGLNTPQGVTNLSIAVENNVGLTLSQPPANSPPGTPPNVTAPGTMTMKNITISDQTEVLGHTCTTLGMLAEDSNFNLLICQESGGNAPAWQPAMGGNTGWVTVPGCDQTVNMLHGAGESCYHNTYDYNPIQICQSAGYTTYTGACQAYDNIGAQPGQISGSVGADVYNSHNNITCIYGGSSDGGGRNVALNLQILCIK